MSRELEYAKKIVLVCKLFRSGLLSEKEFEKVKRKLSEMYPLVTEPTFWDGAAA